MYNGITDVDVDQNCFVVEFDAMRKGRLENVIPGSTFTNISTKNMQGSKNYDNIWISRHAKLHHFTGQAGMRYNPHTLCLSILFQNVGNLPHEILHIIERLCWVAFYAVVKNTLAWCEPKSPKTAAILSLESNPRSS